MQIMHLDVKRKGITLI